MVEVLVALLALSMGLLGLASLHVNALRTNQSADLASLAVQQAYDMVERMRANPAGVAADRYDNLSGIPTCQSGGIGCVNNNLPDCTAASCTTAQLATYDHHHWNTSNGRVLPGGSGRVTDTGNNVFWIAVLWIDKTLEGATSWQAGTEAATACGAPAANTRCYFIRYRA